jgi:RNA polymerase sigma factor for flagellar operon FliA
LLAEGLDLLPARDRAVMLAYYYQGKVMREIAHDLGVGESRICQMRGRALLLLRRYFEKLGFVSLSEVRL